MDTTRLRKLLDGASITLPVAVIESEPGIDDHTESGVFDEGGEGIALGCYSHHAELLAALLNAAPDLLDASDRATRLEALLDAEASDHRRIAAELCGDWSGPWEQSPVEHLAAAKALEQLARKISNG